MSAQKVSVPKLDQANPGSFQEAQNPGPADPGPQCSSPSAGKSEKGVGTSSNGKEREDNLPAEVCVVIGGSRNTQTQGSYTCGVCGKKYKYYNCFQTHVRAHKETESGCKEGRSQNLSNSFRYTCDICGKKYKYYSCFQEHRDLHTVDGRVYTSQLHSKIVVSECIKLQFPELLFALFNICLSGPDPYEQVVLPMDESKEEEQVEPFQKSGPKTGNYVCDFCGKQYKYFNPYQEHLALHAPIRRSGEMRSSRSKQHPLGNKEHETSKAEHIRKENVFCQKMEGKKQTKMPEANSSQNSSGTSSPKVPSSFSGAHKLYTCGSCGIQFQFYNNLLEHMQSHAADNKNHIKAEPITARPSPTCVEMSVDKNHSAHGEHPPVSTILPEKDHQQIAERLLRVMCTDLGMLNILSGKDFLKLAQILVDTGARHGAFSVRDALGDMGSLALKQLPCTYNQVKVRITCALGSNTSSGIAVTCHSQAVGSDTCFVLTAYQVDGVRLKHYVLGVKEVDLNKGAEQVQHWVQNVLSEFATSEVRTIYVMDPRVWEVPLCGQASMCLRCAGCSLGAVAQAVLGRRNLKARGLHELEELMAACRDLVGVVGHSGDILSLGTSGDVSPTPPACWDQSLEPLLLVHERFEQICEALGRSRRLAPFLQSLNKHLLGILVSLLSPLRQAAVQLSCDRGPTLQNVLPIYLRLERLFASKASDPGAGSRLCHCFLEALKENFIVEKAHEVAMVLDPQQKLRSVPSHQHEEVMRKVCDIAAELKRVSPSGIYGAGKEDRDGEEPPDGKRACLDSGKVWGCGKDEQVRKELLQYLAEPLFHSASDPFQYWRSTMEKYPMLSRLALWLLAAPAVGTHSDCVGLCEQILAMKRKRQVTPEEMNKLIFLRSNMT
ncbi:zinc finger protein 618-like isoform X1 [Scleropages formosus]|uniref:zinc finger protein 618-like isoform X1 n=1 Tax=Scleropages formosus TaxID=113540 RepID=UPI00087894AB|nr:zinc finger protein 618-like isoform X1 [Scleropages formosus]